MSNSRNSENKKVSIKKVNNKKTNSKNIKKCVAEITEISLLLVAFAIVVEILFGSIVPFGSRIITNLTAILSTLGENGLTGLVVLGIVVYIFRRSKVFA
jgi:hypothetical protein